jgi:hypothetical protein
MYYKVIATRPIRNKAIAGSVFGNSTIVGSSRLEFGLESDDDLKTVMKRVKKDYKGWFTSVSSVPLKGQK